jgi:hypothetical protein
MLRTGAAGGVSISSMLRIGAIRGEPVVPPFVPTLDKRLGGTSPSISNMLRTGDRGFVKGDEARPDVLELADPLVRPAVGPSNKARTSLRSSSNIDSNDICLAIFVIAVESVRCGFPMSN